MASTSSAPAACLTTKAFAPRRNASRAKAGSSCIVRTTTVVLGDPSKIDGIDTRLGSPGMFRSRTSTPGFRPEVRRRAVSASPTSATTSMSPSASTIRRRPSRTISWSSARMIVIVLASLGRSVVIRLVAGTVVASGSERGEAAGSGRNLLLVALDLLGHRVERVLGALGVNGTDPELAAGVLGRILERPLPVGGLILRPRPQVLGALLGVGAEIVQGFTSSADRLVDRRAKLILCALARAVQIVERILEMLGGGVVLLGCLCHWFLLFASFALAEASLHRGRAAGIGGKHRDQPRAMHG